MARRQDHRLDPGDDLRGDAGLRESGHGPGRASFLVVGRPRIVDGVVKPERGLDLVGARGLTPRGVQLMETILQVNRRVIGALWLGVCGGEGRAYGTFGTLGPELLPESA